MSETDCAVCDQVGGSLVWCVQCDLPKKPFGRDSRTGGFCDSDCPGYPQMPTPGSLWPGERYGDSLGHEDWHEDVAPRRALAAARGGVEGG